MRDSVLSCFANITGMRLDNKKTYSVYVQQSGLTCLKPQTTKDNFSTTLIKEAVSFIPPECPFICQTFRAQDRSQAK